MIVAHHGGEGLALAAILSGAGGLSGGLLVARMELVRLLRRFRRRREGLEPRTPGRKT